MLTNKEIDYVEFLTKELVKSIKDTQKEFFSNGKGHIFSSPNRAKFKRLRVELTKHLVQVERELYK